MNQDFISNNSPNQAVSNVDCDTVGCTPFGDALHVS